MRRVHDINSYNTLTSNDSKGLNSDVASVSSAIKLQEKRYSAKDLWHPFEKLQKTYTKKELQVKFIKISFILLNFTIYLIII